MIKNTQNDEMNSFKLVLNQYIKNTVISF